MSKIKVKCADDAMRRLNCTPDWVDISNGKELRLNFSEPIARRHTGTLWLRMDSDSIGWTRPTRMAVITDEIYPWIAIGVMMALYLCGFIPTLVWMFCFRIKDKIEKHYHKKAKQEEAKRRQEQKEEARNIQDWQLQGWQKM